MTVWTHNTENLEPLLDYLNQIDSIGKTKFTMQVQDEDKLEFLDLKLIFKNGKIADIFANPTNSFPYICYLLVATLEKVLIKYHMVYIVFCLRFI